MDLADSEAAVKTDAGREALEVVEPRLALSALLRLLRPTVGIVEEIDDFSKRRKTKQFDKETVHIASRDHVGFFALRIDSFQRCRPAVERKLKISPSHSTHRYIGLLDKMLRYSHISPYIPYSDYSLDQRPISNQETFLWGPSLRPDGLRPAPVQQDDSTDWKLSGPEAGNHECYINVMLRACHPP